MKHWLIDTGPIVALLVGDDTQHARALDRDFGAYRKHRRQTLSLVTPW